MAEFAMSIPSVVRPVPLGGKYARGRVAWVDEWNYLWVMLYSWSCWQYQRGDNLHGPYPQARNPATGQAVFMHSLITGRKYIDHRNGDGLDCRESNLRDATASQNQANRGPSPNGSSKYKGVGWARREHQWRARLRHEGREYGLGYFPGTPTGEIAAARARDQFAQELLGEFAWLNRDHFPELR